MGKKAALVSVDGLPQTSWTGSGPAFQMSPSWKFERTSGSVGGEYLLTGCAGPRLAYLTPQGTVRVAGDRLCRLRDGDPTPRIRRSLGRIPQQHGTTRGCSKDWDVAHGGSTAILVGRKVEQLLALRTASQATGTYAKGLRRDGGRRR